MKKLILTIFYLFIFNSPAIALVEVDITRGNLESFTYSCFSTLY